MTSRISLSMFPAVTIRERLMRWRNTRSLAAGCALASSLVAAGNADGPGVNHRGVAVNNPCRITFIRDAIILPAIHRLRAPPVPA